MKPKPMKFKLTVHRTELGKTRGVAEVPEGFVRTEGPYPFVSGAAIERNKKQRANWEYIYAPEPVDS